MYVPTLHYNENSLYQILFQFNYQTKIILTGSSMNKKKVCT